MIPEESVSLVFGQAEHMGRVETADQLLKHSVTDLPAWWHRTKRRCWRRCCLRKQAVDHADRVQMGTDSWKRDLLTDGRMRDAEDGDGPRRKSAQERGEDQRRQESPAGEMRMVDDQKEEGQSLWLLTTVCRPSQLSSKNGG